MFRDRSEAGLRLAEKLEHLRGRDLRVLALPRGGVPVAFEVARTLGAPLDVVLVRKVGVPSQPELAMAAIVDGEQPEVVENRDIVAELGIREETLQAAARRELAEIERRRRRYQGDRPPLAVEGRTVIVVDDGIATGATCRAALHATRRRGPSHLVLAVPVAPPDTLARMREEVDELVCLHAPTWFGAVGAFYDDFRQIDDDEVVALLERARGLAASPPAGAPSA